MDRPGLEPKEIRKLFGRAATADVRGSGGYANDTVNEPRKSRRSYDREFEGDFIGSPRGNVRFRRSASEKVKVPCEYHCEPEESLSPLTLRCSSLISPRSVSAADSRKAGRRISAAYGNSVYGSPIGKIRNIGTHARDNSYSRYLVTVPAIPLLHFPARLRFLGTVPWISRVCFPNFSDRGAFKFQSATISPDANATNRTTVFVFIPRSALSILADRYRITFNRRRNASGS